MATSILVVDDVKDWRDMLVGLIGDIYRDATIVSAASVEEAKKHLDAGCFDLAVIDIRLDELDENNVDGLILMEYIQAHQSSNRIIIVTGYASIQAVERAMRPDAMGVRPAVDFIEKGRLHQELLPRLKTIL